MLLTKAFFRFKKPVWLFALSLLIVGGYVWDWPMVLAQDPTTRLTHTLQAAQKAGPFEVQIDYTQTQPTASSRIDENGRTSFTIRGQIQSAHQARFDFSNPSYRGESAMTSLEYLMVDGITYRRLGESWERVESLPAGQQVEEGGLALAKAARDVVALSDQETPAGRYQRVAFALPADEVLRFLLSRQGAVSPDSLALARLNAPRVEGTGELWIDPAGLPGRLILDLTAQDPHKSQSPVRIHSVATYSSFGFNFPAGTFDPTASATTLQPLAGKKMQRYGPPTVSLLLSILGVGFALALLTIRRCRLTQIVTVIVLITLLSPSFTGVVEAVHQESASPQPAEEPQPVGGELAQLLDETRALSSNIQIGTNPAFNLVESQDYDFDSLPNGLETQLGTNPFVVDSDQDGLTDYQELAGIPCGASVVVETDPTNPDSNGDGINDGAEFQYGECTTTTHTGAFDDIPNAWNDDNDGDEVPDWLDLSPFTASKSLAKEDEPGPNFTFESLDQDPGPEIKPYPYYVELQIRPTEDVQSLQWAFQKFYWPFDMEGPIQVLNPGPDLKSSGELQLVPFLEVQTTCQDLPTGATMQEYGIQYTALSDDGCSKADAPYAMQIPLLPVEEGGLVHAFQAKVLHDNFPNLGTQLVQHWQNVRLKWVVQADISLVNEQGLPVPSADGFYGIVVYETPFKITGMQVTRQGGVSMLAAANIPESGIVHSPETTDGPIALLRAGLESQFLTGALNLTTIKNRFNAPSSATEEQRWGLQENFRIRYDQSMDYQHMDQAIKHLTSQVTPALLDEVYGNFTSVEPTLILASEQRTSVVNLDEVLIADFNQLVFNTCLNPLVTSRSLKLQKYEHNGFPADWRALTLDGVLQRLDLQMPNYAVPVSAQRQGTTPVVISGHDLVEQAAAHNIKKLATTAWFMGQTAIQTIGDTSLQSLDPSLNDAAVAAEFLNEQGILPDAYNDAIDALLDVAEAGGPEAWLQQQWNRSVGVVTGVSDFVGSFLDFTPELTMPGEADFLSWTHTGINLLNFLALVSGEKIFGQVANILSTVIEVYQTVRVIIDTVKAAVDAAANGVQAMIGVIGQELAKLARPLSVVGMIFSIGITWLSLSAIIGDLPPGLAAVAVSDAIVQTVILVVLFVLAAAIPIIGTAIAVVVMLTQALSNLIGIPLTPSDLTSALLGDLFAVEVQASASMVNQEITAPTIEAIDSLGGLVAGRKFALTTYAEITLQGSNKLLSPSKVAVMLGHELMQGWGKNGYIDTLWSAKANYSWPPAKEEMVPIAPPFIYEQVHKSKADLTVNPALPKRNAKLSVDLLLNAHLAQLIGNAFDEAINVPPLFCGDGCWLQGEAKDPLFPGLKPPSAIWIGPITLDIIPDSLEEFWHWSELANFDQDGDGLFAIEPPDSEMAFGPDAGLCDGVNNALISKNTHKSSDSDFDGLSDLFEIGTPGLDPCDWDSDDDGLWDGKELRLGTNPGIYDTDGDGVRDGKEFPRWSSGRIVPAWRIKVDNAVGFFALNPAAYPNPRQANLDGDHRNDGEEEAKLSSPNARNPKDGTEFGFPITVSALGVAAPHMALVVINALAEEEQMGLSPTLVMTLPNAVVDALVNIDVTPLLGESALDNAVLVPGGPDNVLTYQLPPLIPGRQVAVDVKAPAGTPDGLEGLAIALSYEQGGRRLQQVRTLQPSGRSRLMVAITQPADDLFLNGATPIQGTARGYPGATQVLVCVTTAESCPQEQFQPARGATRWSALFQPTADGTYRIFAYAKNDLGQQSPVVGPVTVHYDSTPPGDLALDLADTTALSTTTTADGLPALLLPVRATDTGSGLATIGLTDSRGRAESATLPSRRQGQETLQIPWPLAGIPRDEGPAALTTQVISLTLTAADHAGNTFRTQAPVRLLVDDVPPAVQAALPQVVDGAQLRITGYTDDRRNEPGARQPYSRTRSATDAGSRLNLAAAGDGAVIVGDMNGDGLDEIVLTQAATAGTPIQVGLIFGSPELPPTLALADADVVLQGQATGVAPYAPTAANAGDVNGDGLDDLLIGDPGARRGAGTAYLLLGRPQSSWFTPYPLAGANRAFGPDGTTGFGFSLAGGGDTDGDGLDDYLLAAADDGSGNGAVWLVLGQEESTPPIYGPWQMALAPACNGCVTFTPPALAGPGDVNGDGLDDLLIGYPQTAALIPGRERTRWPTGMTTIDAVTDTAFDTVGDVINVSPMGDMNSDGLMDLLMADPDSSPARVFVVMGRRGEAPWPLTRGKVDLLSQSDMIYVESSVADSRLGIGLAPLGDVDGDRLADFAMSQPGRRSGPNRVLLALSSLRVGVERQSLEASQVTQIIEGTGATGDLFGRTISSGQVNGDGVFDLLTVAPGNRQNPGAYLFQPDRGSALYSGLVRVEMGAVGPITDPALQPAQVRPHSWRSATLGATIRAPLPRGCPGCWSGTLNLPDSGIYFIYARGLDAAGNWSPEADWFQGTVNMATQTADRSEQESAGAFNLDLGQPQMVNGRTVGTTVSIGSQNNIREWRFFDGSTWQDLPQVATSLPVSGSLPALDNEPLTLRLAARSIFGITDHVSHTLTVDNQPPLLLPTASLQPHQWHTDLSPTLVVTWPEVSDGSGVVGVWAAIDTVNNTVPTTAALANRVARTLSDPGAYYIHIRAKDGAGNETLLHLGPFGVNRSRTPSAIAVDGFLDLAGGEYPESSLISLDPLGDFGEAALWGLWNDEALFLAHEEIGWGPARQLFVYLDTGSGGIDSALPAFSTTHTLPFAADHLVVVGTENRKGYEVYQQLGGAWRVADGAGWQVVVQGGTEIGIDRNAVSARGAVDIVAYVMDRQGLQQIFPPTARPAEARERTANLQLGESLRWDSLTTDVEPRSGQTQLTAPEIVITSVQADRLTEGQKLEFTVAMTRPRSRLSRPPVLILESSPEMVFTGMTGADCLNCPANGSLWRLSKDLNPGQAGQFQVQARVQEALPEGTHPVSVTVGIEAGRQNITPAGVHTWIVDLTVGGLQFFDPADTIYVQPGPYKVGLDLLGNLLSCLSDVEVNTGSGYTPACPSGNCASLTGNISPDATLLLQSRLARDGRTSPVAQVSLVADSMAPTTFISPTQVLSTDQPYLTGLSQDTFPAQVAPRQVQVSVDGGPFASALVSPSQDPTGRSAGRTGRGEWIFPVRLNKSDGAEVQVAVRAVDSAGNIGPTATTRITVDNTGPVIQTLQEGSVLIIDAQDGSGVDTVAVSLDGGATYQLAQKNGQAWRFTLPNNTARVPSRTALVQATDPWGNRSLNATPMKSGMGHSIYLPTIRR